MNKEECKQFIEEYFTQDNFGTAYPIYFCIRDYKLIPSTDEDYDCLRLVSKDDYSVLCAFDNNIEVVEYLKNNYKDNKLLTEDFIQENIHYWNFDRVLVNILDDIGLELTPMRKVYIYKQMFLLRSEAEEHLKNNYYHYEDNATVFCMHSWRCDRQKDFFESIRKILVE